MLAFKARPRKDPALSAQLSPSQRRMMRTLREAREATQRALRGKQGDVIRLLLHAPVTQIVRAVPTDAWINVQAEIQAELQAELIDAGRRVKLPPIQKATIAYRFDDARPEAAAWAAKEAGTLIQNITNDQLAFVRDVVSRASMGEFTPMQAAQVFRQMEDGMGLTVQQSEWVENFRQQRITDGMGRGLSYEQAEQASVKATGRYADRIYRYRTETIARTEIMRASNEGRNQAWAQGIEGGWIAPDSLKKWSVELDGRECSICRPLGDLDPIPINASFPQGDPPVHPNCRCTVVLTDEIPADLLSMTDDELEAEISRLLDERQVVTFDLPQVGDERFGESYDKLPGQESWEQSLTPEERTALRDYTGKSGDFSADSLNTAIRAGALTPEQAARVSAITAAVDSAERLGIAPKTALYRGQSLEVQGPQAGISDQEYRQRLYDRTREIYPLGAEIDLGRGAFISTSTDVTPALDASATRTSPGIIFEIQPTPGAPMQSVTRYDDEYEILLARNTKFRVIGIQQDQMFFDSALQERPRTVVQLQRID